MNNKYVLSKCFTLFLCLALLALIAGVASTDPPEVVALFNGPMPMGITISHTGRTFVCFPRWGDKVTYTVAEVKNGQTVAYPNAALIFQSIALPREVALSTTYLTSRATRGRPNNCSALRRLGGRGLAWRGRDL